MNKIKLTILILINIFLEFFCLWLLLYFNTFINDSFLPAKFIWDNGIKRNKPIFSSLIWSNLILCGEAALILCILYLLNRWLFIDLLDLDKPNTIAKRLFIVCGLFTFIIILFTTILEL
jgi:cytochrome c oxidase assembly factor CtaG